MFQIDLTTSGELQLHMPNNCVIEIQASAAGIAFIKKVILDHNRGLRNQLGYIGTLPTQHAVDRAFADKFLHNKAIAAANDKVEEVKGKAKKLDIDWDKLEISI